MFYVLPCVILFLYLSVLLVLQSPCLGKRELILVLFVRLFDLCFFGFVGFLCLLMSGKGCGFFTFFVIMALPETFFRTGTGKSRYAGSCFELPTPRWIADQGLRVPYTLDIATQVQITVIQKQLSKCHIKQMRYIQNPFFK